MADNKYVHERLASLGYELLRYDGPHPVYRHTVKGARLTVAVSPSDWRSTANLLATAARLAGVSNQGREAREGERRQRKPKAAPAAVDPRAAGPEIPSRPEPAPTNGAGPVVVEQIVEPARNVPVTIANISGRDPKPKPLPNVSAAHIRAVDNLPKGMRDRVLKLAKGDYSKIKILADNRVEVSS